MVTFKYIFLLFLLFVVVVEEFVVRVFKGGKVTVPVCLYLSRCFLEEFIAYSEARFLQFF